MDHVGVLENKRDFFFFFFYISFANERDKLYLDLSAFIRSKYCMFLCINSKPRKFSKETSKNIYVSKAFTLSQCTITYLNLAILLLFLKKKLTLKYFCPKQAHGPTLYGNSLLSLTYTSYEKYKKG